MSHTILDIMVIMIICVAFLASIPLLHFVESVTRRSTSWEIEEMPNLVELEFDHSSLESVIDSGTRTEAK